MENLLTHEEIKEITLTAKMNPALRNPKFLSFGIERTSLLKITPEKGIILVHGDSSTGFTHISDRHGYWSDKTYWRSGTQESIDTPSQFGKKSLPIVDYIEIIDRLFCEENLNIDKNKNPSIFDLYSGKANSKYLGEAKYHMLIYKGTQIVHTLYPDSKKNNKKKIINLVRGKAKGELFFNPFQAVIGVPYSDKSGKIRYSFQINLNYDDKIEKGFIINHVLNKDADVYERSIEKIVEFNRLIMDIDFADLSDIERIIKKLDKE